MVNQADDNGKIIRFVPLDHGQKVTGFTGARLYYPPRSDNEYGDYVTGVESDGAWDFTIPVGVLRAGRVGCNLAFIDGDGETYTRNVVFLVEPAVSGVFDSEDGQQTRLDKVIGTVQTAADTAIDNVNETADDAVERINQTASDAVDSIGKAEASLNESVTDARGSADAAANSANQASASASAAQTSERNVANSATQASQSATAANQSETNAAESERNAASSSEQAANIVASVSGSVTQAEAASRSASQSAASAAGSASAAGGNAQAAADSASKAGESATAAGLYLLVEIAEYWGIPYLDLKESTSVPMGLSGRLPSGSVNPEAVTLRTNAFRVSSSDGRPNEKAHAYRSTYIENFLRSL